MLSEYAEELLEHAVDLEGLEVRRQHWPLAQELVDAGLASLGPARGPGGAWRRLVPVETPSTGKRTP